MIKALELVEDESDVQAAKELRAEVRADIAEFDENEPGASVANEQTDPNADSSAILEKTDEVTLKVENEFKLIETEVTVLFII